MYQAYHAIEAVEPHSDVPAVLADVVGPICETGDFLAKDRELAVLAGDLLAVKSAGAYASSMASNYNTRTRAAEVMVNQGEQRLIRRRETLCDLWKDEIV